MHATRLRHYWRSQGWACHDAVDIDLMRWGLIVETTAPGNARTLAANCFLLTDAGRKMLGNVITANRRRRSRHAQAIQDVAAHLTREGRLVFTELSVRTVLENRWRLCKPDVYSLVPGLQADHLVPLVHEIKVSRADLLGELRSGKIERYRELAAAIYFVIADGIAEADEIPVRYGVATWSAAREVNPKQCADKACEADTVVRGSVRIVRPATLCSRQLETRHWMALAKARPFDGEILSPQLSF